MDDYSLEEVKKIVESDKLTAFILRAILDNATRRIEIYNDEECIEILKYLLENANFDSKNSIKEEIKNYLEKVNNIDNHGNSEIIENVDNIDKGSNLKTFVVAVFLLVIVCVLMFFLNR